MDHQALSQRLDTLIAALLEQKRRELNAGRKKVRVVVTGDNFSSLPAAMLSLAALDGAGFQLLVTFSHSACISGLKHAYADKIDSTCVGALYCDQQPTADADYSSLFLPALSTNSLSKIALGIRDNVASSWAFHALNRRIKVIATLNPECLNREATGFPLPLLSRLAEYVTTLEQYGIVIAGKKIPAASQKLLTLSDILTFSGDAGLRVARHTLITPAARDEIRRQNITIIQEP
ncbi:hypothetical protein M976_03356 [Buttiauxella ferragutiae ATCC 51602]|uniref:Flavoprotein domain-containing protein n=1 Tax=Buttiauxella ferragutiae ATCC 51602 TaxID=1354252 RepID=A0ABX2W5K5_9ENTR|nr:hypothetical protein [Buttiauxella ferragutiae]OAT26064.1 hypothetical protein M976_03356 [Buttiauxella ferragutiae ATCC 51602]